jgi:hypothetical protein
VNLPGGEGRAEGLGFAYYGPNAAHPTHLEKGVKWQKFLSDPDSLRIEDSTMPLQDYPYVMSLDLQTLNTIGMGT